jgi:hypothetical protein
MNTKVSQPEAVARLAIRGPVPAPSADVYCALALFCNVYPPNKKLTLVKIFEILASFEIRMLRYQLLWQH